MPNIIVNERSVTGQAAHPAEADALMHTLAATYKALEPMLCGGALYAHSLVGAGALTDAMSIYEWLKLRHTGPMQVVRFVILDMVTKRPKIDNWLRDHVPAHACQHTTSAGTHDRAFSALAGAAQMHGWLLSIRDCPDFPRGPIEVTYSEQAENLRPCHLEHFVVPDDATAIRRVYEPSDKHKLTTSQTGGVRIAPMDLKPDEAQRALDWARAIPGEKRAFALHDHKLYVFFAHTTLRYHGYLVEDPLEYQSRDADIYNQLLAWGWVQ